jgi:hypothetical protein
MKTIRIFPIAILFLGFANLTIAQTKEESFKVSGNCGMCKSKIEKAAKSAGASYAIWDVDTKILTLKYDNSSTNTARIQKEIAKVGYDNPGFKASEEAYGKLHTCCKYDREELNSMECCKDGKCEMQACKDAGCCKDGKCDMSICKEKGCCANMKENSAMSCCKKEEGKAACCAKKSE